MEHSNAIPENTQVTMEAIAEEIIVITHTCFLHVKRQARTMRQPIITEIPYLDTNANEHTEAEEARLSMPPMDQ